MYANLMVELNKPENKNKPVQEDLILHMIYNSIREKAHRFKTEYGKLVICVDDMNYWRKDSFPHYKHKRKASRDKSSLDWEAIFKCIQKAQLYIENYFPYKFVKVARAEADDVIATLTPHIAATGEEVLIVSRDSDFAQLHKYKGVKQFSPIDKRFISVNDPERYLKEKILRGDTSDSIPNFLSDDDTYVAAGKRMKSMFEEKLFGKPATETTPSVPGYLDTDIEDYTVEQQANFKRNQKLIDFSFIPKDIRAAILEEFEKPIKGSKMLLMQHFQEKRMRTMMNFITDF
jgi:hypothetical protein